MGGDSEMSSTPKSIFKRWMLDQRGTIAIIFGLTVIPFVIVAGGTVDYGRAVTARTSMQQASDAAALAGAGLQNATDSDRITAAVASFNTNYDGARHVTATPTVSVNNGTVSVSATAGVPTPFLSIVGIQQYQVATSASAVEDKNGDQICMLALDATMEKAIDFTGNSVLTATNCAVHSNSTHIIGMHSQGGANATAKSFCSSGGVSGPEGFSPEPENCYSVADPFASLTPPPVVDACVGSNLKLKNTVRDLSPGVYCNGLNIGSGGVVHFSAGTYVIKDGGLIFDGGSVVVGTGVTFYFVGSGTFLNISSSADVNLTAPTSGDYEGLVFYQDPTSNPGQLNGQVNKLNGSGAIIITGSIYFPTQPLEITGGASFGASSDFLMMVANNFILSSELHLKLDADAANMSPNIARARGGTVLVN
jgi:Flp pilus assembly protein TadG